MNNPSDTKKSKKRLRNDIILLCSLLFVFSALITLMLVMAKNGTSVAIYVDDEPWGRYSLAHDTQVEIQGVGGKNTLVIKDGKAYFADASCPDRLCVRESGKKSKGESIICLPNRVIAVIE